MQKRAEVTCFEDVGPSDSCTAQYVVRDPESNSCAIIDPVWDFDYNSGCFGGANIEKIMTFVKEKKYKVDWLLETHAHADHISSARKLQQLFKKEGNKGELQVGIGDHIKQVQKTFGAIFNLSDFEPDGSHFDKLFADNEEFFIGKLPVQVLYTPGHTPACISYHIKQDCVFVGDTLFAPDYGTARCDFPRGDAGTLYDSITQKIFTLPDQTRLFLCHDYKPGGRDYMYETTVGEQKSKNIHLGGNVTKADFVKMRTERDAQLNVPRLLLPSIQLNIRGGSLPKKEGNGYAYLKIPLDLLGS